MKFQAPKGTRDFYPPQMAWRNYLEDAWRRVSVRNGFEEVEGPIFEPLDLYKVKSGEAIVNELFHFEDRGERELAIRPEFTPTLARMIAAQANALPRPIKWFSIPNLCRAERPQRGRLREFLQWNCDIVGTDSPVADAECIFTAVDLLAELKLRPDQVKVRISHRQAVQRILSDSGVSEDQMPAAFELIDRREKIPPEEFATGLTKLGLEPDGLGEFTTSFQQRYNAGFTEKKSVDPDWETYCPSWGHEVLEPLDRQIVNFGIADWCEYDLGIVRGLAYYTGIVFEIHETTGALRALAGGGRYDKLIELFGGPPMPAVGFGMGDVVLTEVLSDKGLIPPDLRPGPDVFIIGATEQGAQHITGVAALLRRAGLHARFSYKTTRNLSKLLREAADAGARFAVILDDRTTSSSTGAVAIKDLQTKDGQQADVALAWNSNGHSLVRHLQNKLRQDLNQQGG
jgi:histidyl-tRNA synthetase